MDIFSEHGDAAQADTDTPLVKVFTDDEVKTFEELVHRPELPDTLRQELMRADIVLLPRWGFRDVEGPLFPHGTQDFYHYLLQYKPSDLAIDVAATDDEFMEIALYSNLMADLATLLVHLPYVKEIVPLVVAYCNWKRYQKVKVGIKVTSGNGKAVTISYEGMPGKIESTLEPILARLWVEASNNAQEQARLPAAPDLRALPSPPEAVSLGSVVIPADHPKRRKTKDKKKEKKGE